MPPPNANLILIGRIMTGLVVLFMLGASVAPKLFFPEAGQAYATMDQLGWPRKFILMIGILELLATLLYAIPRTSLLGAILMTGILGGAIATHIRVESPLFSHTLFGVYLGIFMWLGLWLRDPAIRAMLPFKIGRGERI
jgi:hypothetical protein